MPIKTLETNILVIEFLSFLSIKKCPLLYNIIPKINAFNQAEIEDANAIPVWPKNCINKMFKNVSILYDCSIPNKNVVIGR